MALRGLSGPETARTGVIFGISGMAIAITTTLIVAAHSWILILLGILIGGSIGTFIAFPFLLNLIR
ncbi:MAG: NAD(P)(+) transhydrogenase (Re/Si-specific) subunit beta [Spirochaetales bacterium]|nr:NAD(P)(+) transhydrogenase (Re/Si-specific) subunit beta [Spirochaetales bacterium]